jgi:hypothetical protein
MTRGHCRALMAETERVADLVNVGLVSVTIYDRKIPRTLYARLDSSPTCAASMLAFFLGFERGIVGRFVTRYAL